jgi:hypothetical protein
MASLRIISILLLSLLLVPPAQEVVLDWSSVSWAAGSLSNTYDVDGDAVNDVTITISGDTTALVTGYPAITTALEGGLGSADSGLELKVNFANASQSITVTVTFLNDYVGAKDVSFSLFDIDANRVGASSNYRYRDYLDNLAATGDSGLIPPNLSVGSADSIAGSGTNQTVTGNSAVADTGTGSGNGNVSVSYGTNNVNEFSFTFGNTGSILAGNPQEQTIAIYDLNFKPKVPEVGSSALAILACLGVVGIHRFLALRKRAS